MASQWSLRLLATVLKGNLQAYETRVTPLWFPQSEIITLILWHVDRGVLSVLSHISFSPHRSTYAMNMLQDFVVLNDFTFKWE